VAPVRAPPRAFAPYALAALGLVLVLVTLTVAERIAFRDKVLPGVEVSGTSLAGDREAEALAALEEMAVRLETTTVRARGGGQRLSLEPAQLTYDVDAAATMRAARRAGRTRNPLAQVSGTVLRRLRPDEVALAATWDETQLSAALDVWDQALAAGLENGGLEFRGAEVIELEPRSGYGLNRLEATELVEDHLRSGDTGTIVLPVGETDPAVGREAVERAARRARRILSAPFTLTVETTPITIAPEQVGSAMTATPVEDRLELGVDAARLRDALGPALAPFEAVPVDAGWTVDGTTAVVVPATPGRAVDVEAVAEAILREQRAITGAIVEVPAALTTEAAQALNITEKVSEFTTNFTAGQERVKNIQKAADIVNNTLVRPGETFSLNDKLGPRNAENGWVRAPAFSGDQGFFDDYGGGVSQFSTTLFNATFFGGYRDVQHTPHSIFISRYPMGREATLNYGSIDNRFQNDSGSGVLIVTSYTATSVTVAYYGNREGRVVRAEGPNVLEEIPVEVVYEDTPFLEVGQEAQASGESGYTGYRVENFRIIERPGQEPTRERFYWEYDMRPRKILRGTRPPTLAPVPTPVG
jgi:vancomycin resistance protein YoaR